MIKEILKFTNFTNFLDDKFNTISSRKSKLLTLFLSGLHSNIDLESSHIFQSNKFYNQKFSISSLNFTSILIIEIFIFIYFTSISYINLFINFYFSNIFTFFWIIFLISIIYKNSSKINNLIYHKNIVLIDKNQNQKVILNMKKSFYLLLINLIFLILLLSLFNLYFLTALNIFLFLIFLELLSYILYFITKYHPFNEIYFYKNIASKIRNILNHILILFLSILTLTSNLVIYNNFNLHLNFIVFFILLVITTCFVIFAKSYNLPILIIISLNSVFLESFNSELLFIFFLSYVIFIISLKHNYSYLKNKFFIINIICIFILSLISFSLLYFFGYFIFLISFIIISILYFYLIQIFKLDQI